MNRYVGDFTPGKTVRLMFNTNKSDGTPITLAGTPVVSVYKDASTTESTAGVSLTVDLDSRTGLHQVVVDTSADGTFYAAGSDFRAVLTAGTVDGVSVVGVVVGGFSISNRSALRPTTADRTLDVSATGEAGVDWANVGSPTTAVNLSATTISTAQTLALTTAQHAQVADDVTVGLTQQGYTTVRAAKLDNLDVATSTRLPSSSYSAPPSESTIATNVWANGTRTLTSGGSGGATAQEVWEYGTRTLTSGGGGGGLDAAGTLAALGLSDPDLGARLDAIYAAMNIFGGGTAIGTPTTTSIKLSGLPAATLITGFFVTPDSMHCVCTSGANFGRSNLIATDTVSGSDHTFTFASAWPAAPQAGDTFLITL